MLLASPAAKDVNMTGWKIVIGGSALPKSLAKAALERGIDIFAGYGMSETCPILTLSGLMPKMNSWGFERQVEIRCKAGRPLPLAQIRIVDGEMNDLPHLDRLMQVETVRLFVERAQAARPDFRLTVENARAISDICHQLDGLPLAIELAAARMRRLSPQALLQHFGAAMGGRLQLLTGGPPAPPTNLRIPLP